MPPDSVVDEVPLLATLDTSSVFVIISLFRCLAMLTSLSGSITLPSSGLIPVEYEILLIPILVSISVHLLLLKLHKI